ncbi:MAG: 30S ribosomal protein S21 [Candidatus Omnitrophica bacterium]|nr:30S ribosomal protein S21 [Candidatus Omnitrophota bacterium]
MAEVRIDKAEDFEKALRRFKMQCKKEGILKKFRERQYYTKPSEKRRKNVKKKRKR